MLACRFEPAEVGGHLHRVVGPLLQLRVLRLGLLQDGTGKSSVTCGGLETSSGIHLLQSVIRQTPACPGASPVKGLRSGQKPRSSFAEWRSQQSQGYFFLAAEGQNGSLIVPNLGITFGQQGCLISPTRFVSSVSHLAHAFCSSCLCFLGAAGRPPRRKAGQLGRNLSRMGGANQPLAHAQFGSNVVDYGDEDHGSTRAASVFSRLALIDSTLTASGFFLLEAGVPS